MAETQTSDVTQMSDKAKTSDMIGHFITLVEVIEAKNLQLSRLGAGILAALLLDGAHDSRAFSRLFDIAHALVLRELTQLASEDGFLIILRRDERTQRSFYALSPAGERLKKQLVI